VDFDLDEYNGRWCVTPEFPNGTYAYFVAISFQRHAGVSLQHRARLLWQPGWRQRLDHLGNRRDEFSRQHQYRVGGLPLRLMTARARRHFRWVRCAGRQRQPRLDRFVTITLPSSPPNPPANAPITSVTLAGSITGTNISRIRPRHGSSRHVHDPIERPTGTQTSSSLSIPRPDLHAHKRIHHQLTEMKPRAGKNPAAHPLLLATGAGAADLRVDFVRNSTASAASF
jgi:hypothetical protein